MVSKALKGNLDMYKAVIQLLHKRAAVLCTETTVPGVFLEKLSAVRTVSFRNKKETLFKKNIYHMTVMK